MTVENQDAIETTKSFGNYLIHGIDEIILPDTIAWWPTAPGWQVLGAISLVFILLQAARSARRWWRNRYRREALRQLSSVQQQAGSELYDVVATLPYYIKVTALQAYPRQDVASLSGNSWLMFLDAHYSGPLFATGLGEKLLSVAYLPREQWSLSDQQSDTLIRMSRKWIAEHKDTAHV